MKEGWIIVIILDWLYIGYYVYIFIWRLLCFIKYVYVFFMGFYVILIVYMFCLNFNYFNRNINNMLFEFLFIILFSIINIIMYLYILYICIWKI